MRDLWIIAVVGSTMGISAAPPRAQEPAVAQPDAVVAIDWPRSFDTDIGELVLYQPQVDSWKDERIAARMAVAVRAKGATEPVYGAIWLEAVTRTNVATRIVSLGDVRIRDAKFAEPGDVSKGDVLRVTSAAIEGLPKKNLSMDRIVANLERTALEDQEREVELDDTPPVIEVVHEPAILVQLDGDPYMQSIAGTRLLHMANTEWDLLHDRSKRDYHLFVDDSWLTTKRLDGAWRWAKSAPKDVAKIPEDHPRAHLRGTALKPTGDRAVPDVRFATEPTELVVIEGAPRVESIADTGVSFVANTTADLLKLDGGETWYLTTAGRWFAAERLGGPWRSLRAGGLPAAFAAIPAEHAKGHVLVGVPGTPQANEAVLVAEIPRRTAVSRKNTKLDVLWNGPPQFEAIAGTELEHGVNTSFDVLRIRSRYYCCASGVWFVADAPEGPWKPCDDVPDEVHDIPSEHPLHYTSYSYVYDSSDDTIVYGYLGGYLGCYVRGGVVVYGTGFRYPGRVVLGRWIAYPRTYGCGVVYYPFGGGYAYATKSYHPYHYTYTRAGYAPTVGWTSRAGVRGHDAFAPWAKSRVDTSATAHLRDARGLAAGFVGGRQAAGYGPGRVGAGAKAPRNVYVGSGGGVFRRGDAGQWHRSNGRGWSKVSGVPAISGLNRAHAARGVGNARAQAYRARASAAPRAAPRGGFRGGAFGGLGRR